MEISIGMDESHSSFNIANIFTKRTDQRISSDMEGEGETMSIDSHKLNITFTRHTYKHTHTHDSRSLDSTLPYIFYTHCFRTLIFVTFYFMSHAIEASFISYLTDYGRSILCLVRFLSETILLVQFEVLCSPFIHQQRNCCVQVETRRNIRLANADNMQYRPMFAQRRHTFCSPVSFFLYTILWLVSETGQHSAPFTKRIFFFLLYSRENDQHNSREQRKKGLIFIPKIKINFAFVPYCHG